MGEPSHHLGCFHSGKSGAILLDTRGGRKEISSQGLYRPTILGGPELLDKGYNAAALKQYLES